MPERLIGNDYSLLRQVIVQPLLGEHRRTLPLFADINLAGFTADLVGDRAVIQHQMFCDLLRNEGIEVMELNILLDQALKNGQPEEQLDSLLKGYFPHLAGRRNITSLDLLGASKQPDLKSEFLSSRPQQWMFYTRDLAVTLPQGVILGAFTQPSRKRENVLTRFVFQNSDALSHIPVVFDAEEHGVCFEGGDVVVFDENTVLMGVDNMTSRKAAKKVAEIAGVDVIAIAMPPGLTSDEPQKDLTEINHLFLHLDTIFNLLGNDKAVVIPYFMENEFSQDNPFYAILNSVSSAALNGSQIEMIKRLKMQIQKLGVVNVFERNTGRESDTGLKLVDFMRRNFNTKFAYIGGPPETNPASQTQHLVEAVLRETRFQAGNVLATKPENVIMYGDDTNETMKSIEKLGVVVSKLEGYELTRWNGGPHCMTCPIRRDPYN